MFLARWSQTGRPMASTTRQTLAEGARAGGHGIEDGGGIGALAKATTRELADR